MLTGNWKKNGPRETTAPVGRDRDQDRQAGHQPDGCVLLNDQLANLVCWLDSRK